MSEQKKQRPPEVVRRITRAVARLARDEQAEALVPIEVIAEELDVSEHTVRRWGLDGVQGVFLDVVHRKSAGGWITARAAVTRFQAKRAALPPAAAVAGEGRCPLNRSRTEQAAAADRLAGEQVLPLRELRGATGASEKGLRRWALEGRSGVYLDAITDPERGLVSSVAAVRRFLVQLDRARRKGKGARLC